MRPYRFVDENTRSKVESRLQVGGFCSVSTLPMGPGFCLRTWKLKSSRFWLDLVTAQMTYLQRYAVAIVVLGSDGSLMFFGLQWKA